MKCTRIGGLEQRAALELLAACVQVSVVVGIVAASFRRVLESPAPSCASRSTRVVPLGFGFAVQQPRTLGHIEATSCSCTTPLGTPFLDKLDPLLRPWPMDGATAGRAPSTVSRPFVRLPYKRWGAPFSRPQSAVLDTVCSRSIFCGEIRVPPRWFLEENPMCADCLTAGRHSARLLCITSSTDEMVARSSDPDNPAESVQPLPREICEMGEVATGRIAVRFHNRGGAGGISTAEPQKDRGPFLARLR